MSNRFFSYIANLNPFTRARAGDVSDNIQSIEAAFEAVGAELDRTVHVAPGEAAMAVLPSKAARANKSAFFDADGNIVGAIAATSDDMAAAVAAAVSASQSKADALASANAAQESANSIALTTALAYANSNLI